MPLFTATAFSTNDTQLFIDCLFGPQQHDEHCKGWRFHFYMIDSERRFQAVMAEARKAAAERREAEGIADAIEASEAV